MSKEAIIRRDAGLKHEAIKTIAAFVLLDKDYYVETEKTIETDKKEYRIDVWGSREQKKRRTNEVNGAYEEPPREVILVEICGSNENYKQNREKLIELAPKLGSDTGDVLLKTEDFGDDIYAIKKELQKHL